MTTRPIAGLFFLAMTLSLTSQAGCKKSSDSTDKTADTAADESKASATAQVYTTRGMVKAMAKNELTIHHEAIVDFKNAAGDVQPMMSMSMPFGLTDGIKASDVAVGDAVEFTFAVDFKGDPVSKITEVKKLPADSELKLTGH